MTPKSFIYNRYPYSQAGIQSAFASNPRRGPSGPPRLGEGWLFRAAYDSSAKGVTVVRWTKVEPHSPTISWPRFVARLTVLRHLCQSRPWANMGQGALATVASMAALATYNLQVAGRIIADRVRIPPSPPSQNGHPRSCLPIPCWPPALFGAKLKEHETRIPGAPAPHTFRHHRTGAAGR